MKKLIIGCMLLSSVAQAEPFVEVGIGAVIDPIIGVVSRMVQDVLIIQ